MKQLLLVTTMVLATLMACAQKEIRLNGYGIYNFDDHVSSTYDPYNYYDGKIKAGGMWGAGLEFLAMGQYCIELIYLAENTTAPMNYQAGSTVLPKYDELDLKLDYILLGFERHQVAPNGKVEGFGGIQLGMAIMDAENPSTHSSASATKFAWGARLGAIIWGTDKIGIKLQAQILSIAQGAGGGLYFGTSGAGVGLSTYSTIYQFGLGGGLTIKLGH